MEPRDWTFELGQHRMCTMALHASERMKRGAAVRHPRAEISHSDRPPLPLQWREKPRTRGPEWLLFNALGCMSPALLPGQVSPGAQPSWPVSTYRARSGPGEMEPVGWRDFTVSLGMESPGLKTDHSRRPRPWHLTLVTCSSSRSSSSSSNLREGKTEHRKNSHLRELGSTGDTFTERLPHATDQP